jgi:hypothetical protein
MLKLVSLILFIQLLCQTTAFDDDELKQIDYKIVCYYTNWYF